MATYIVNGGKKLAGTYSVSGAKNAGPKLIIAAMLSNAECNLSNIPRISDTEKIMEAIREMGGECEWTGDHEVRVDCKNLNKSEVPEVVLTARHVVLFIGATLARTGKVSIGTIGGDATFGKRPVDRLISGLESIGATCKEQDGKIEMTLPERPASRDYTFAKNTHTGTESLILGSIFNDGKVVIRNAAAEPEVDNLITFLNTIGAKVERTESRTIEIIGVPKLLEGGGGVSMYDRLEAGTALALQYLAGDSLKLENVEPEMVKYFVEELDKVKRTGKASILKTSIHPGFITDWQPIMSLVLALRAEGRSEIHEMVYEQRWSALEELAKMGLKYELFHPEGYTANDYNFNEREFNSNKPYGAYVWGRVELVGAEVESCDVRAGMTLLIAALFAKGESKIKDPKDHILRGYENIVGKLKALGADIKSA